MLCLTLQTAACMMASKPDSGESRLAEILCPMTLFSKAAVSVVRLRRFWKLKAGWQEVPRCGLGSLLFLFI